MHFGCRSPPIASSKPIRGCWPGPRACTTGHPTGVRFSTRWRACGASTPVTAGAKSPRRSPSSSAPWNTRRPFQMGHSHRLRAGPIGWSRSGPPGWIAFSLTTSGSESVDTALKIAVAYHRARGAGQRVRFIGREQGYPRRGFRRHLRRRHREQPQVLRRLHAARRGSSAAYPGHRTQCLLARAAAVGCPSRRRVGAPDRPARRLDHRRRHRRAHLRIRRRHPAAHRLPEAFAGNLRQARHPLDIRRGDHGLRPRRQTIREPGLRRDPPIS